MAEAPRTKLDAIELLMQDHREVESLFREFEYLRTRDEDAGHVIEAACAELRMNDTLSTEFFCPAMLEAAGGADVGHLLAGVRERQQAIRHLLIDVERADADPAKRDARFNLLSERVERQFEETEAQVFPHARTLDGLDLVAVADQMKARRSQLALQI